MQIALFRIWTQVAKSTSYNNNYYTTSTSMIYIWWKINGKSGYTKNTDNEFSSEYFILFLLKELFQLKKK